MSGNDILKNCRKSFKGYMRKSYIKVSVFAEIGDLNLEGGDFWGGVFGLVTPVLYFNSFSGHFCNVFRHHCFCSKVYVSITNLTHCKTL